MRNIALALTLCFLSACAAPPMATVEEYVSSSKESSGFFGNSSMDIPTNIRYDTFISELLKAAPSCLSGEIYTPGDHSTQTTSSAMIVTSSIKIMNGSYALFSIQSKVKYPGLSPKKPLNVKEMHEDGMFFYAAEIRRNNDGASVTVTRYFNKLNGLQYGFGDVVNGFESIAKTGKTTCPFK